jgi:small subunit ribosomal protein S17
MAEKKQVKKTPTKPAVKKTPVKPAAKKVPVKVAAVKVAATKTVAKPAVKPEVKTPAVVKPTPKKVAEDSARGLRKTRIGKVLSNKMNKTVVVEIVNKIPHPIYGKVVVTTTKFKVHDEKNECGIGDTVEIMETRPLSRDKYFRLLRIIEKAK